MKKNNHSRKFVENKSKEDVFGAYLLDNTKFDGYYDIPTVNTPENIHLPSKLVSYSELTNVECDKFTFCHFYQKDYTFDGRNGIWNSLIQNLQFKKGFNLEKLDKVYAVICPDFSTYYDMPRIMQIWNVYRSRAVGCSLAKLGYFVVPNVRWTDNKSYNYSFSGLQYGGVVAVSTLGCLRANADNKLFYSGLKELIKRVRPSCMIIYGSLAKKIKMILETNHQKYVFFPAQIAEAMRKKYGNESK